MNATKWFILLPIICALLFLVDIALGSVYISLGDIWKSLFGLSDNSVHTLIIQQFRLPKAITAIVAGVGISVSGLLMQTFFRNPLAGPYVLGVSSGASLGAASVVLLGGIWPLWLLRSPYAIVVAAMLGSAVVLVLVLSFASKVGNVVTLLIIGLMTASFVSALVSVMQFFSEAEQIQTFLFWSFGSLGGVGYEQLSILSVMIAIGLLFSWRIVSELNVLIVGENYARSMGVSVNTLRYTVILATCLMAGAITAFCGPIAFLGLAVPHMARLIFKTSNHKILLPASILIGAAFMLGCDIVCQLPGSELSIPINAVTSLIGAPVVISIVLKRRREW